MEAVVYEEFGGPEVLQTRVIDEPHAGPGEVRITVRAAGVNPFDYKLWHGYLQPNLPASLPATPGFEVSGVVDEIGEGVTGFAIGDEVVGWSKTGGYAQFAVTATIAKKPANLSFEEAVALPVAGETSARALRELGVKDGETLLVHGAAGGVGAVGVQLALALGATVIGTASEANHEYLRSLGVIPVLYGEGLVDRVRAVAPQGIDAVYDVAGKGALPDSIELRGGTERIVTVADMTAAEHGIPFSQGTGDPVQQAADLAAQLQQAVDGNLKLKVAETFPLAEVTKAAEISESGHVNGKLVLKP